MPEMSIQNQIRLSNMELSSQLMQGTFGAISKIADYNNHISSLSVNNSGKMIYAAEGDSKYKEETDSNSDGIITFNEYVKYITENLSAKSNLPKLNIIVKNESVSNTGGLKYNAVNLRKVFASYLNYTVKYPMSLIEKEA